MSGGAGCSTTGLGLQWLFLLPLLLVGRRAIAGESPDARNTSIDTNRFHLDPTGTGVVTTASAEPLEHRVFRAEVVLQHLSPTLVVLDEDGGVARYLVASRQQLDIAAAFGFLHRYDVSVMLPVILHQRAWLPGYNLGAVASDGVGDLVITPRARLLSQKEKAPLSLAVSAALTVPTGDEHAWMGTGAAALATRLDLSRKTGEYTVAVNFGFKLQRRTSLHNMVDGNKLTWAVGVVREAESGNYRSALEFIGATRAAAPFQNPEETTGELVFGGAVPLVGPIWLEGGFAFGVLTGVPTPAWRVWAGATGTFEPKKK